VTTFKIDPWRRLFSECQSSRNRLEKALEYRDLIAVSAATDLGKVAKRMIGKHTARSLPMGTQIVANASAWRTAAPSTGRGMEQRAPNEI